MPEILTLPYPPVLQPPDWLECATVAAMMLWPDDQDMRRRWVRAERIRLWEPKVDKMPLALLREFTNDILASPERLDDLRAAADRRVASGLIMGMEVLEAVMLTHFMLDSAQLHRIRERTEAALADSAYAISAENLGKPTSRVAKFRPVAHLWAEYCNATLMANKSGELKAARLPCLPEALPMFLRQADAFRWKAEKTFTSKHSTDPVMRPGEAVLFDQNIIDRLPKIKSLKVVR